MDQQLSTYSPVPMSWVENLFDKMTMLYGNRFLDSLPPVERKKVKEFWADEMGKVSREDLKRGVALLVTREWPPSLPEFIQMCKPKIDVLTAYYEALEGVRSRKAGKFGTWSHPAVYWAAMPLSFELQNQTYSQIKNAWESAFNAQLAKGSWEKIPDPDPAPIALLAAPPKRSEEQVLRDIGVAKALKPRTDHRAWIDKVLNDKNAPMIAKKFAREAQGIKEHDL